MKSRFGYILSYGTLIVLVFIIIRVGYFKEYNTFVNINNYLSDATPFDIEVQIDDRIVIVDLVDSLEYSFFGKTHPVRVNPGRHKIIVKSDKLKMIDSSIFYSIWYSHFYIEIGEDLLGETRGISIDKRFGRTIVFE
jgi:hypothetical protein